MQARPGFPEPSKSAVGVRANRAALYFGEAQATDKDPLVRTKTAAKRLNFEAFLSQGHRLPEHATILRHD